jgi:hypothetical protein
MICASEEEEEGTNEFLFLIVSIFAFYLFSVELFVSVTA